jgi:hypothetical protein
MYRNRRIYRCYRCHQPFASDSVLYMVQIRGPPLSPHRRVATAAVHEKCARPAEHAFAAGQNTVECDGCHRTMRPCVPLFSRHTCSGTLRWWCCGAVGHGGHRYRNSIACIAVAPFGLDGRARCSTAPLGAEPARGIIADWPLPAQREAVGAAGDLPTRPTADQRRRRGRSLRTSTRHRGDAYI